MDHQIKGSLLLKINFYDHISTFYIDLIDGDDSESESDCCSI